jgi:uncharacterized RDD family membrane protein YckC
VSERPPDKGALTPGDPLAGAPSAVPPHPSGLPGVPEAPRQAPEYPAPPPGHGLQQPGYGPQSPAPPGAGGPPSWPSPSPSPIAGRYVLSGWWRRVGASIIDGLVIGIPATVILVALGASIFATGDDSDAGLIAFIGAFLVAALVFVLIGIFYAPVMMAKTNGKTVGRMVAGIRVIRANGQPMDFGTAALREVVLKWLVFGVIANSVTFGLASLIDVLWPLWDEENRALHDFPVNTRTIID